MAQLKIRTGVVFFFFYCYNVSPLLDSTVSYHVALDPIGVIAFPFLSVVGLAFQLAF